MTTPPTDTNQGCPDAEPAQPAPTGHTWTVQIGRTFSATVTVSADTAQDAAERVYDRTFPLPPLEQWEGHKDWWMTVTDSAGEIVLDDR